jgi:hypothetical protein
MDSGFGAQLDQWHDFFSTVAGVSGALVGLLFVALGLNPALMADDGPAGQRVIAGQTFHAFISLLIIGIVGLVPDPTGQALAITLAIVGVQGIIRIGFDLRNASQDPDPTWHGRQAFTRFLSPLIAYVFCIWLAYEIWNQRADNLPWFIAVILSLTVSAAATAWDLLRYVGEHSQEEAG